MEHCGGGMKVKPYKKWDVMHDVATAMLIGEIISELPFWIFDNEWKRFFMLILISFLVYIQIWSKRKEPIAYETQDGSNQE